MNERGFTLLELLVVTGLLSILMPILATTIRSISTQTVENSTRISALTPLENTGRWLSEDIPLAQATSLPDDSSTWPTITLEWTSWVDTSQYDTYTAPAAVYQRSEITYSLSGSDLQRQYRTCDDWNLDTVICDGSWTSSVFIAARKINSVLFSRSGSIFTVSAGSYPRGIEHAGEDRNFKIYGALLGSQDPIQ